MNPEFIGAEKAIVVTVPFADIGAGPGTPLKDLYAMSYYKGIYVDDSAPNAKTARDAPENFGTYTIPGGETGPVAPSFTVSAAPIEATLSPGSTATFVITTTHTGGPNGTLNFTLTGLPEGFEGSFDPEAGALEVNGTLATSLMVSIPDEASEDVHALTVMVQSGESNETIELSITVDADAPVPSSQTPDPSESSPVETSQPANGTAAGNETAGSPADGGGVPGLGSVLTFALVALAAVVARRRK